jgi:polysaccharide chain length determinant protein (PEP-CTERM system associated)
MTISERGLMPDERELRLEDYIAILRRRWLIILSLSVIGCGVGFGIAHFLPKRYTSKTLVLVQQPTVPDEYVKPVVSEGTGERLATMQQEILSRTRLEPIIQQFGLFREDVSRVAMEDLVARLRDSITVTPVEPMAETRAQGLPGFTVGVTFPDPRLAQQICSTITSMFMEENLQLRQRQAEQTTQFLTKQLDDAKAKLDEQDAKLATFERRYLGSLPDDEQRNINVLQGLNTELDASSQAISRAQQDKTFAESALNQQLAQWQSSQDGSNPQTDEQQLTSLQTQLESMKSRYTDDHPDVLRLKRDIEALKQKIAQADTQTESANKDKEKAKRPSAEPPEMQLLRAQVRQNDQTIKERTAEQAETRRRIALYQSRVESTPEVELEYKQLTRDYQTALGFYNDLLKKRDQSAMATDLERRQQGEQFQVLDPANLPDSPSFPKRLNFGMGGLAAGLALGCCITILLEMRDTSLRTERDIEVLLHVPVLATVPQLKSLSQRKESSVSPAA